MARRIDPALIPSQPHLDFERALWQQGLQLVAGIDEAGRGALAGPITAAAVILPQSVPILKQLEGIQDSKQLTQQERERQRALIESLSLSWSVGFANNTEIDYLRVIGATRLAIQRALGQLQFSPEHLLVDFLTLPEEPLPQTRLVKGDARSLSIAAASILAKTHRDALMISAGEQYPDYGFPENKGYGTKAHRQAIQNKGPCPLHRLTFAPLRDQI